MTAYVKISFSKSRLQFSLWIWSSLVWSGWDCHDGYADVMAPHYPEVFSVLPAWLMVHGRPGPATGSMAWIILYYFWHGNENIFYRKQFPGCCLTEALTDFCWFPWKAFTCGKACTGSSSKMEGFIRIRLRWWSVM